MPILQQRLKQVGGDAVAPERRSPEYLAQFLADRNQEMGRPDQGERRFILIAADRMCFTYPLSHTAHLARCTMQEIDERLGASGCADSSLYGEIVMSLAIKHLNAPLGAEISGLDLSKPIAPPEVMTIEDVWRERLVVVFH